MRICLTFDIDWAPEFVIEWAVERVKKAGVPATWFATHDSGVLRSIAGESGQEIGLHPNFFPGSTQGKDMEEVINYLLALYPGARGIRSHALLDSTRHQQYYGKRGIKYVSNAVIWNKPSVPFFLPWAGIWQIPISWEDDVACGYVKELSFKLPEDSDDTLWVFTFHPLYCYLNEKPGMSAYGRVKAECPDLKEASREFLDPLRHSGKGLISVLDSVLKKTDSHHRFVTLGLGCNELRKERT